MSGSEVYMMVVSGMWVHRLAKFDATTGVGRKIWQWRWNDIPTRGSSFHINCPLHPPTWVCYIYITPWSSPWCTKTTFRVLRHGMFIFVCARTFTRIYSLLVLFLALCLRRRWHTVPSPCLSSAMGFSLLVHASVAPASGRDSSPWAIRSFRALGDEYTADYITRRSVAVEEEDWWA